MDENKGKAIDLTLKIGPSSPEHQHNQIQHPFNQKALGFVGLVALEILLCGCEVQTVHKLSATIVA
ncbi:hypothetical protein CASFOL_035355 [Castilleja foliolosa]|uniref:Uncharacterized protein n=1 Tax=Castilleja foliolosa TaxID=1961234 RepID=A0ABD3BSD4_9LAMI